MIFRKRKSNSVFMNRFVILFLAVVIIFCYTPADTYANLMEKGDIVTISEGRELEGSDGKPYYLAAGYYTARFSNSSGSGFDYRVCRAISPKKVLLINNGKERHMGYCLEHGAWMNSGSTTYKGTAEKLKSLYWMKPYSDNVIKWMEIALLFGRQPGMKESDVPVAGCNLDDWYFATQNIIWEFQQGLRTSPDSIKSNPKTQEYNWYSKTMTGRPAYKMYKWMLSQMSRYNKNLSFTSSSSTGAPLLKLCKNDDGTWSGQFTDHKKVGQDIISENKHVSVSRSGNIYTIKTDIEPHSLGTVSFKKTAKVKYGLLAFSSGVKSDITNHLQSIVWGAADPVRMYMRFGEGNSNEDIQPVLPLFSVSVSKKDLNPGFDGRNDTGMGDAALNATVAISVKTKSGIVEESIELDETGKCENYVFQPWMSGDDLTRSVSVTDEHTYITYSGQAEVITEESNVPDGRLSENASGTGNGIRSHIIKYWAQSVDGGAFTYKIDCDGRTYSNISEDTEIALKDDTFVNDNYRGQFQLIKSKTDLDPFTDNGKGVVGTEGSSTSTGSGSDNVSSGKYSTSSKWTVRLLSGGYENNEFIKVMPLRSGEKGFDEYSSNYRVTRDSSGVSADSDNPLTVSRFGRLNIVDLPYGSYEIKEISADSKGYVLEKFIVKITENGQLISTDVENKPKENTIKVVKVNSETGKTVRVDGTSFRIRYLGNPDSDNPQADNNYGRYLANGSNPKDGHNYIFNCDINGEIVIPYQLEYGKYQLEEITAPEGYYIGQDDDNRNFNRYEFLVNEQSEHTDGRDYTTYYAVIKMKNKPVRGRIKIIKSGENDDTAVANTSFEVYSAQDISEIDGVVPVSAFKTADDSKIKLKTEKRDHALKENPVETRKAVLPAATITQVSEKKSGMSNVTRTVYDISSAEGALYKSESEKTENGIKSSYNMECRMEYTAGGMSRTRVHVTKISESVEEGLELNKTEPEIYYGGNSVKLIDNILEDGSRIIQNASNLEEYKDDGRYIQEYDFTLINHYVSDKSFKFAFDDIELETIVKNETSTTRIKSGDSHPQIEASSDYKCDTVNKTTVFKCVPDNAAPVYFKTNDGIKTDMILSGGRTLINLKIMQSQLKSFRNPAPEISYNGSIVDWSSKLTPENSSFEWMFDENNYLKAERHEKSVSDRETYYTVKIVSNSTSEGNGFRVIYPDSTECQAVMGDDGKNAHMIFVSEDATLFSPRGLPVEILTTDENGIAVSGELPLGEYYIHETESGKGYVNSGEWKKISLDYKDHLTGIVWNSEKFSNKKADIRINIRKLFETNKGSKTYLPGSGAVFGIYSAKDNKLIGKITSGRDGYATGVFKAAEGKYYAKEISVPAGYKKSGEKYYFEIKDRILKPLELCFKDHGTYCSIYNNLSGETVIHMEQLYRFPDEEIKTSSGTVRTKVTDSRKIVEIRLKDNSSTDVYQGDRNLFSVEAGEKSFVISFDERLDTQFDSSLSDGYTEKRKDGQVILEFSPVAVRTDVITTGIFEKFISGKQCEYTVLSRNGEKLVSFSAEDDMANIVFSGNEKAVYKENSELNDLSNAYLKSGESVVAEYDNNVKIKATLGSDNSLNISCTDSEDDNTKQDFTFLYNNQQILPENAIVKTVYSRTYARTSSECDNICTFINDVENDAETVYGGGSVPEKKEGKLIIKKVNAETGKTLEGAEFDILDENKNIILHIITDSKGIAEADHLQPGIYYYRETTAPKGYIADNAAYVVQIRENETFTVTVMNEKIEKTPNREKKPEKPEKPEKINAKKKGPGPETGDTADSRFYILLIAALVLLTALIAAENKNSR